jgi:hypothetical protein
MDTARLTTTMLLVAATVAFALAGALPAPSTWQSTTTGTEGPSSAQLYDCWDGRGRSLELSHAPVGTRCEAIGHGWTRCTRPLAHTREEANFEPEFWCKASEQANVPSVKPGRRRVCHDVYGRLHAPFAVLTNAQCHTVAAGWTHCTTLTGAHVSCKDFLMLPFVHYD